MSRREKKDSSSFPTFFVGRQDDSTNYWILGVQEDVYSSVYSCDADGPGADGTLAEFAWVLTREMDPPQEVVRREGAD